MKSHLYRVTVEHLEDAKGNAVQTEPLHFGARNHDDLLFLIMERSKARGDFAEGEATAFALGLKLSSEVMLNHRGNELFTSLQPHFGEFMKGLKRG